MSARPMTANTERAFRQYQDINKELDSLKSQRDQLLEASVENESHHDLLKKIQQLDQEISSKESVLDDIRVKNPTLKTQFEQLKRRMSETAQTTQLLLQQNQQQKEQNISAQKALTDLKIKLVEEEKQRLSISGQLAEIKELLLTDDLDEDTKEILEARLSAAEEALAINVEEKEKVKKKYSTGSLDQQTLFPTKESALESLRDKEQKYLQESRHKRSLSGASH